MIDSTVTKCFVTPSYIAVVGLKGIPRDIFLELVNGEKYLSRGYVSNVLVVTVGMTDKIGLTMTNLLHEVDLVLGINWLQLVNPVVDWGGARLYVPNTVPTPYCRVTGCHVTWSQELLLCCLGRRNSNV